MLTVEALRAVGATDARASEVREPLAAACALYGIDTTKRLAAFLAQVGHESVGFAHASEVWGPTAAQRRYEGRVDLGNVQPGDGSRFRGHGFIQTTGRANHAKVRDRLRERLSIEVPDFEAEPERLAELQWACLSAADYWDMRNLNALADAGDFEKITRRVNGGLNGYADRCARWERVKAVLADQPAPEPSGVPANPFLNEQEPTMAPVLAPILKFALPALVSAVPELVRMFGSGGEITERNAKAAELAVSIATEAIGARNEQEMVETLQVDPQAAATVRQAIQQQYFRLEEVGGGIQAAQEFSLKVQGDKGLPHNPAFTISLILLVFPLMLLVDVFYVHPESYSADGLRTQIVTGVLMVISMVAGFWLGTSFSSSKKDDALLRR